jgi:predicted PurR-regulated permease PerM
MREPPRKKFWERLSNLLLVRLFLTVSTFIVFVALQVPFPLILSLIAGMLDIIPGIDATLGVGIVNAAEAANHPTIA